MKPYNSTDNPRFVWNIGAIAENYPDMAGAHTNCLWDRQEQAAVLELRSHYANLFCLETTTSGPLSDTERWLNNLDNEVLESEGIPPTKEPQPEPGWWVVCFLAEEEIVLVSDGGRVRRAGTYTEYHVSDFAFIRKLDLD